MGLCTSKAKVSDQNQIENLHEYIDKLCIESAKRKTAFIEQSLVNSGIEQADGSFHWCQYGILHRDGDKPEIINYNNGNIISSFYKNGKFHRDGDLPAIENENLKMWYQCGELHRDSDFPAIEGRNFKQWFRNGKLHRDRDLPAIIYENGDQYWYVNGENRRDGDQPPIVRKNSIMYCCKNNV
jgi:antitoxin component YwqK of YwqJK toxin-antitoxin module